MKKVQEQWIKDPHMAEVKLTYKSSPQSRNNPIISGPDDAYEYLSMIWEEGTIELQEQFVVLLLNNAKRVIGWSKISTGGSSSTIVNISSILQIAVLSNAQAVVLAHNHPSSHNRPSIADCRLTRMIKQSLRGVDISVDDHLILLPEGGYYSFRDQGQL